MEKYVIGRMLEEKKNERKTEKRNERKEKIK